MELSYYIKNPSLRTDPRVTDLLGALSAAGHSVTECVSEVPAGCDMLLAVGGDGTFLDAAHLAGQAGVPLLGVNMGHMGFLSEYSPAEVEAALSSGGFSVELRDMLDVEGVGAESPCVLNEVGILRSGATILSIEVEIDGHRLPTYFADGLLVSTPSGSTAYNLSAGGPICAPDVRALLLTPVSPHNLNLRPMVVPRSSVIAVRPFSKDGSGVMITLDNRTFNVASGSTVKIHASDFELKRVRPGKSGFFDALRSKLFWGEDIRNV